VNTPDPALIARIDAILPQTQCRQCGFDGCQPYAAAIAGGEADINQCPPGGAAGIAALAALLGRAVIALNPQHGVDKPRELAVIDETRCIGCTLCIQACPTDAIVGAAKLMHTVIAAECTGCGLCVPPCPVDCITLPALQPARPARLAEPERSHARERYRFRQFRLQRDAQERAARLAARSPRAASPVAETPTPSAADARQAKIAAMMARAQAKLAGAHTPPPAEPQTSDADAQKQARIAAAMARAAALRKEQ
jgi:electron transport complex protein RnfB